MNPIRDFARASFRFGIIWAFDLVSLLLTAALLPGIGFRGPQNLLVVAAATAFLLGIINVLIRPLILLLALPFGFIAIFLVGFFLNAIALALTSQLVEGFYVQTWLDAFLGSLLLAVFNTILTGMVAVDNDDSFYLFITEHLAKREPFATAETTQGIIMLEIDGLSFHHVQKAIAQGWMPTLRELQAKEGYVLSRFDCGLPSQTSACQAGIMFGDNFDIPAFRWYDKSQGKLIVSSHDAPELNARYAKGAGLMRGGSSVNNMLNGDAHNSILTLADLLSGSEEQQKRRAQDVYLVMLNPYFFLRTLVLFFGDVVREILEGILQQLRREAPRLNRLEHFYPFLRAATTVLMRDISAALAMLDIVRGTPALYVTWPGYDEVAHHSGPWTRDAFRTLRQYDKVIHRILETIQHKAPRPYELVVLSDHGQSYGWTFKQRYGKSLHELIIELTPSGTGIQHSSGGDDGMVSVNAMAMELDNLQQRKMGGRVGRRVIGSTRRAVRRGIRADAQSQNIPPPSDDDGTPHIVVCGSGNLAQVYFTQHPARVSLEALHEMYPQLLDRLVAHEGIGIVLVYTDSGQVIVLGKRGARNIFTDDVTGEDPLAMYGDAALRAQQLKRLAEFPHNGDLTIISTLYPDGTVAAMEELVGNHGGLGGEQTDAFIFHPNTFTVPATSNSVDVFRVLNARRDVIPAPQAPPPPSRQTDAWHPRALWLGLARIAKWFPLILRALVLDRRAYRQIALDPYMTAPALVLAAVVNFMLMLLARGQVDLSDWGARMLSWGLSVLLAFGAARLLRGNGDFTTTLRVMGFASVARVIELFALLPPLSIVARIAALIVQFLAIWLGVSEAHRLRGWRTVALPVVVFLVAAASIILFNLLLLGLEFSIENIMRVLDVLPRASSQ